MTLPSRSWQATIQLTARRPALAEWLVAALGPEAAREVPRAGATVARTAPGSLTIAIEAADAGAMRAALNTYLGWVALGVATARTASGTGGGPPSRSA